MAEELELLATRGCHLCEQAEGLLVQAAAARPLRWRYTDIAHDEQLMVTYGQRIPVLRRAGQELDWPFGLLDMLRLADEV